MGLERAAFELGMDEIAELDPRVKDSWVALFSGSGIYTGWRFGSIPDFEGNAHRTRKIL
jgi:hypothetical protein